MTYDIDFKLEAIVLISKSIAGFVEDTSIVDRFLSYNLDYKAVNELFDSYHEFKNKLIEYIPTIIEEDHIFFKPFSNDQIFFCDFYLFAKHHKHLNQSLLDEFMLDYLEDQFLLELDSINLSILVEAVMKLDLDEAHKWMVIRFYTQFEKLSERLMAYVNPLSYHIEKHYPLIETQIQSMHVQITKEKPLYLRLNDILHSDYFKENNFKLVFTIFHFNRLIVLDFEGKYVYLGFLLFQMNQMKIESIQEENKILNALKVIADPSRFKILKLLQQQSMYAQEIAKQLNLTAATLTHHIDILLKENFIELELMENERKKIYYRTNQHFIKQFIKRFEDQLYEN